MTANLDAPVVEQRHPPPTRGQRFRLTRLLLDQLSAHELGRDLIPFSAGADYKVGERRPYSLESLPGMLIAYCSTGKGELVIEDQSYAIRPGDLIVLDKGTRIFLAPRPGESWTQHFLVFGGTQAEAFVRHLGASGPITQIGLQPRLTAEIDATVALRNSALRLEVFIEAACRLKWLLSWLAVLIRDAAKDEVTDSIDRSLLYMIEKLDGHLDLDELAEISGLSRYQYVRRFRERNGHAPIHYFIHLKMQRACEMLETTELDIRKIAEALGYDDPYYFSKMFKRMIGASPQHYRRNRIT